MRFYIHLIRMKVACRNNLFIFQNLYIEIIVRYTAITAATW